MLTCTCTAVMFTGTNNKTCERLHRLFLSAGKHPAQISQHNEILFENCHSRQNLGHSFLAILGNPGTYSRLSQRKARLMYLRCPPECHCPQFVLKKIGSSGKIGIVNPSKIPACCHISDFCCVQIGLPGRLASQDWENKLS